jgi:uncharacterized repeat protein (TIGR02543 family)
MMKKKVLLLTGGLILSATLLSIAFAGCGSACEHELVHEIANKATCTEDGNEEYWLCNVCNNKYTSTDCTSKWNNVVIPKTGHSYDSTYVYDGDNHWQVCKNCSELSDKVAHSGGQATCIAKAKCTICGMQYGALDSSNHVGETELRGVVTATAEVNGYTGDTYCLDCNQKIADGQVIPATGISHNHSLSKVDRVEATCTTNGNIEYYTCSGCDKLFSDENGNSEISSSDTVIQLKNHDYGTVTYSWSTDNSQCTATRICKNNSSHIETETVNSEYSLLRDATCTDEGAAKYTSGSFVNATFTTQTKEVAIPVNAENHTYSIDWSKDDDYHWHAATCTHNVDGKDKASHSWDTGEITTQPTTESTGIRTYTCTVCGQTKTESVDKLPSNHEHNYNQQVADERYLKEVATCITKAVYYYSCLCGEQGTETFEYGDFAEHDYGDWIEELPATCVNTGTIAHYHCLVCGKDFNNDKEELSTIVIPATNVHSYVNGKCEVCSTPQQVEVVFKNDNGDVISCQNVNYGDSAVEPTRPTKSGYVFAGWDKDYFCVKQATEIIATYQQSADNQFVVLYSYDSTTKQMTVSVTLCGNVKFAGYQGYLELSVVGATLTADNNKVTSHGNSNVVATANGIKISFSFASKDNVVTETNFLSYSFAVKDISTLKIKAELHIDEICDNAENDCVYAIISKNYQVQEEL